MNYLLTNGKLKVIKKNITESSTQEDKVEVICFSVGLYLCKITRCNNVTVSIERSWDF